MVNRWIALNIGNSRLHWAWFENEELKAHWDTAHFNEFQVQTLIEQHLNFSAVEISLPNRLRLISDIHPELWIAAVASGQAKLWKDYPNAHWLDLDRIPLRQIYSTLGIDRALSLWGAIQTYYNPALVIDCGTAMTFTASDANRDFLGGAILPGLQLQLRSLGQGTAALPMLESNQGLEPPDRWARTTIEAIQSGVLYTILSGAVSFIEDWRRRIDGVVVLTGGDALTLYKALKQTYPNVAERIQINFELAFLGMRSIRSNMKD